MAELTDSLLVRVDPSVRERLLAYVEAMRRAYGIRISLAAAARAALEKGLPELEADVAAARRRKR